MPGHRRCHQSRCNRVDPNPLTGVLDRGCFRQTDDRMLRRHVGADATFRNQPCYRSVVDDHAAAGLQHLLNFIFHCEKHALHIDGERLIER